MKILIIGFVLIGLAPPAGAMQPTQTSPTTSVEDAIRVLTELNNRAASSDETEDSANMADEELQKIDAAEELLENFIAAKRKVLKTTGGNTQCGLTISCGLNGDSKSKICKYVLPKGYIRDDYGLRASGSGGSASAKWASNDVHSAYIKLKVKCHPLGDAKIKITVCYGVKEDAKDLVLQARQALLAPCDDCQ
jgi:hypothetical protein